MLFSLRPTKGRTGPACAARAGRWEGGRGTPGSGLGSRGTGSCFLLLLLFCRFVCFAHWGPKARPVRSSLDTPGIEGYPRARPAPREPLRANPTLSRRATLGLLLPRHGGSQTFRPVPRHDAVVAPRVQPRGRAARRGRGTEGVKPAYAARELEIPVSATGCRSGTSPACPSFVSLCTTIGSTGSRSEREANLQAECSLKTRSLEVITRSGRWTK
jgi:hypothetical protein